MPQSEARAWWADVQHVRETIERRRADAAQSDASVEHEPPARFARSSSTEPSSDEPTATPGRRFERSGHANHVPVDPDRARARGRRSEVREHWTGVERRDPDRVDRRVARHHDPSRVERRDPGRADRRAAGGGDHAGAGRAERRDASGRAERRSSERRSASGAEPRARSRSQRQSDPRATSRSHLTVATDAPVTDRSQDRRADAPREPTAAQRRAEARQEPFAAAASPTLAAPARRTVQITGRPMNAPRLVEVERRRPARRAVERVGPRPDRVALWAVLLGFFLILVAASSSRGATTAPSAPAATPVVAPAAPADASPR
jgi:hypothetical protein